jgi:hypothetical protein
MAMFFEPSDDADMRQPSSAATAKNKRDGLITHSIDLSVCSLRCIF